MVLDGLGDTFRALLRRILPYRGEEFFLLVVVPLRPSWHTSSSPLHTWLSDIHSSNRTIACWSANIILPMGYFPEICQDICGPPNRRMVPVLGMVLQRGLCLVGIEGSRS